MIEKSFETVSGIIHHWVNDICPGRKTLIFLPGLYLTNTSKSPPSKSSEQGLGDLLVSGVAEASPDSPRSGLLVTGK